MSHVHPKDIGGAILSVDSMPTWGDWRWGGPAWRDHAEGGLAAAIVAAELQGPEPARMAQRWGEVLGREAHETDEGWRVPLEGGELRFVLDHDGRGEGLAAFDVAVRDDVEGVRGKADSLGLVDEAGEVVLCGTRVRLVPA
ncbi:hypothetical protein [Phenylobacterium sp. J367]|uniref:hypothetical protein n=1 Tax=Phenylobacterium sp. J367 TaxID=2898435 RepID=UPI00215142A8|nr:hypothetical protein [Phenylobacterium sp. J367]MCR5877492.1 hypothetical protein [Phenylobacterium sp. J367]